MNLFEQVFRMLSALLSTFTIFHRTFNRDVIFKVRTGAVILKRECARLPVSSAFFSDTKQLVML